MCVCYTIMATNYSSTFLSIFSEWFCGFGDSINLILKNESKDKIRIVDILIRKQARSLVCQLHKKHCKYDGSANLNEKYRHFKFEYLIDFFADLFWNDLKKEINTRAIIHVNMYNTVLKRQRRLIEGGTSFFRYTKSTLVKFFEEMCGKI